jgi:hypothetical protein
MGDAYLHRGAPRHAEAPVPFLSSWVRQTGGKSSPLVLSHRVEE